MLHQDHKKYDTPQAVKSALDAFDTVPLLGKTTYNVEDFSKFFCSELAAAALEIGGVIARINASEVTPIDLCMFSIFGRDYYQIKGIKKKEIKGFNTIDPNGFGI